MKNKKVAIYVRVSTLEQAEHGYSVNEQIDKLKKYCDARDWTIYDEYVDAGFTGSNTNRPDLKRLINDSQLRVFDTVLVYKLDRLSRSQKDTLYLIEDVFNKHGVSFNSLSENFDTSTPFGKAMIGILSVFAQLEREQIKERMQLGKLGRAKSGKVFGWTKAPFGYTYNKETGIYEINELQAQQIRLIFNEYLSGTSITKLRDKMNDDGHIAKDKPWSYRTIRQALDNVSYAGYVKYNGQVFEGTHEAIISKEDYDLVQIELEKRQKQAYEQNNNPRPFQSKYLLAGIGKCGYCNSPLTAVVGVPFKDGSKNVKYKCINRSVKKTKGVTTYNNNQRCTKLDIVDKSVYESIVIDEISKLQNDKSLLDSLIDKAKNQTFDKVTLEKRLKELESKIKKESDLYRNDFITMDELKEKTDAIQLEIKSISMKLEKENANVSDINNQIAKTFIDKVNIKDMSYEEQKKIINSLIKSVYVKNDEITINWIF